jgi:hypothetical protein
VGRRQQWPHSGRAASALHGGDVSSRLRLGDAVPGSGLILAHKPAPDNGSSLSRWVSGGEGGLAGSGWHGAVVDRPHAVPPCVRPDQRTATSPESAQHTVLYIALLICPWRTAPLGSESVATGFSRIRSAVIAPNCRANRRSFCLPATQRGKETGPGSEGRSDLGRTARPHLLAHSVSDLNGSSSP